MTSLSVSSFFLSILNQTDLKQLPKTYFSSYNKDYTTMHELDFFTQAPTPEGSEHEPTQPLELTPLDINKIKEKIFSYPHDRAGFDQFCADIIASPDPHIIQLLIYLVAPPLDKKYNGHFALDKYFNDCPPGYVIKKIYTGFSDTPGPWNPNIPRTTPGHWLERNPRLAMLFITELHKYCLQQLYPAVLQEPSATDQSELIFLDDAEQNQLTKDRDSFYSKPDQIDWDRSFIPLEENIIHLSGTLEYFICRHPEAVSAETVQRFIPYAIEYITHSAAFLQEEAYAQVMSKQPDSAKLLLYKKLRDTKALNAQAERHLIDVLAKIPDQPIPIEQGQCTIYGMSIHLEQVPDAAESVQNLSIRRGEIAVYDKAGAIVGHFSIYDLKSNNDVYSVTVEPLQLSDLFFVQAETTTPLAEQQATFDALTTDYQRYAEHPLVQACKVPLTSLPLKEQAALVQLLRTSDPALDMIQRNALHDPIRLRALLVAQAYAGHGDMFMESVTYPDGLTRPEFKDILTTRYAVDEKHNEYILQTLTRFVDRAEHEATILHADLKQRYPDLSLKIDDIARGLILGALQDLESLKTQDGLEKNRKVAAHYRTQLLERDRATSLSLTYFREIIGLAEQNEIDLNHYRERQNALLKLTKENPALHPLLVDVLVKIEKLYPLPELFWRADRKMEEYNRRSGVRIIDFFKALSARLGKKGIFFEPGAGQGRGIFERSGPLNHYYHDFSLVDKVHYSIRAPMEQLIALDKLATAAGVTALEPSDQEVFYDYIYKTIYLNPGLYEATDEALPEQGVDLVQWYDRAAIGRITKDPNNLKEELRQLNTKLQRSLAVPSDFGILPRPNGHNLHPNKIALSDQSPAVQALIKTFASTPARFLHPEILKDDLKKYIPIFPIGMMLGHFMDIKKFKPNQITGGVDIRAIIYLPGYEESDETEVPPVMTEPEFIEYFVTLADKLTPDSAYFSDSVRENFGKVYRLAEAMAIRQQIDPECKLYIITGPGVSGDDYNQTAAVLGLALLKGDEPVALLGDYLTGSDYQAHLLENYVANENETVLRQLDPSGEHYRRVQEAKRALAAADHPSQIDQSSSTEN